MASGGAGPARGRAAAAGRAAVTAPTTSLPAGFAADQEALPWQRLKGVYCINLDRRPERWTFMQDQLAMHQLHARRFPAVDGSSLDVQRLADGGLINMKAMTRYRLPKEQKLFGVDLTDGGIGCALSHMQIWKDAIERFGNDEDGKFILVMEDDCQFDPSFNEKTLLARLAQVPSDWEMVFLGGADLMQRQAALEVAPGVRQAALEVAPGVRRLYRGFRETTAYLITVAGCKACLEVSVPMSWQIDTHLTENEVEIDGGLTYTVKPRGYCLYPPLVSQERDRFGTDVQKSEHS